MEAVDIFRILFIVSGALQLIIFREFPRKEMFAVIIISVLFYLLGTIVLSYISLLTHPIESGRPFAGLGRVIAAYFCFFAKLCVLNYIPIIYLRRIMRKGKKIARSVPVLLVYGAVVLVVEYFVLISAE